MLYITEKAAEMVKLSAEASGCPDKPLRISAHFDPEGKIRFNMGFDERRPDDLLWESNGIPMVVRRQDEEHLQDVSLDFQNLPNGGPQFAFVTLKEAPSRPPASGCGGCASKAG